MKHRTVDAGGVELHVAELGPADGEPLLLVHGWPQHWWCWRHVAPELDDHRCLMPDLRGHGWSAAPPNGYEKTQLAEDLLNLLDALGIERVCYVGHDWGAVVGFLLALEAPERISSLLALSVPHPWPSLHDRLNPWRWTAGLYQLPLSAPLLGPAIMKAGLTKWALPRAAPAGTISEEDAEIYDRRLSSARGARTTAAMYRASLLRELPAAALFGERRDLEVPARLMMGERDPLARGADLEGFEAHAPEMTLEWVPGAGHFLPEEQPGLVASRARELCSAG